MRTPKNIMRHELIGLECEIVGSTNKSQIGLKGKIINETMKTVMIEKDETRKKVAKKGAVFRLALERAKVDIEGSYIIARPEDRIKKKYKMW